MSERARDFICHWHSELGRIVGNKREAEFELRQMLSYVLKVPRIGFFELNSELDDLVIERLNAMVLKRIERIPLQYILGEWDFMGLTFYVNENVLIPRQDSETLAELAEAIISERAYTNMLDICTGSGCIGISVSKHTGIAVTLSDISDCALKIAEHNAEMNGVCCNIIKSDLFECIEGSYDMITANPPYIESNVCESLQPEVKHEPRIALDGGPDGLDYYRRIRNEFAAHMNPNGILIMEIGYDQGRSVLEIFAGCGKVEIHRDLCGNNRVVTVDLGVD